MSDRVLLVDGNNLAVRAIKAAERAGMSADGISTGPILVFINTLSRYVRELEPDRMVVCWDAGPSARRMALYPEYKAHRPQRDAEEDEERRTTFSVIKEFLTLSGIHHVAQRGYEADDVIAGYWAAHRHDRVVILSNDKDFFQLLEPPTEQIRVGASSEPTDRWSAERVRGVYGCTPAQIPSLMALTGDSSDGVPGVRGIGPKRAAQVMADVGWNFTALATHPKLAGHYDQAVMCYKLVDLRSPFEGLHLAPVPRFRPTVQGDVLFPDLMGYLSRYKLDSVTRRVQVGQLWR